MNHWLGIIGGFGRISAFFGLLMMLPAVVSYIFNDGLATVYFISGVGVLVFGVVLSLIGRRWSKELKLRGGFLLVMITWLVLPVFAAIPLIIALPELTAARAYFEASSGLTASGATVIYGLDTLPPSINFWRAEMIWLGGMGLIVLVLAVLPLWGVGGRGDLLQAEIPGPLKEKKLRPKIAQVAKALWLVYAGLTLLCAISYYVAGMEVLDAILHSFTTLGLGGFSSHDDSIGHYLSPAIEGVAIFFMVIAGMNFATHFTAFSQRSFSPYTKSLECMAYLKLLTIAVVIVSVYLYTQEVYTDWSSAFRYGAFNVVSLATTTGYSNTDYGNWPLVAPIFMLLLANVMACSGSTGGGIKLIRLMIVISQTDTERQKLLHPNAYYDNKVGTSLPQKTTNSVFYFILAYVGTIFFLMLSLMFTGMELVEAFSSALACLSNTGPALGEIGPASTYGDLPASQTLILSFAMLMGRLELLTFLVVLSRSFWRY